MAFEAYSSGVHLIPILSGSEINPISCNAVFTAAQELSPFKVAFSSPCINPFLQPSCFFAQKKIRDRVRCATKEIVGPNFYAILISVLSSFINLQIAENYALARTQITKISGAHFVIRQQSFRERS